MSILDFFPPGMTPRPEQAYVLTEIEKAMAFAEVIAVTAPPAVGKTAISNTIAAWLASHDRSTSILVPTNILVGQQQQSFPDVPVLKRKDFYGSTQSYQVAKDRAKTSLIKACNYHIYMAHKLYSYCMIADEAHKLVDILADMRTVRIWSAEYDYPADLERVGDVLVWIESQDWQNDEVLKKARKGILSIQDCSIVEYKSAMLRGQWSDVLEVVPTSNRGFPPIFWPPKIVRRVILLSATIGPKDIEEMGLGNRKITHIEADSPIDPMRRQIHIHPIARMGSQQLVGACKIIADKLDELMAKHKTEKGLVHIPYSGAAELRKHLTNPRILWHTHENKDAVLKKFKESEEPYVMIASGMYEGVDLPYDKARWQVVAKVPFLNIGSPRVKAKMEADPDWYAWEAIKKVVQGVGRIVRAPDDFGVTYILDANFKTLWSKDVERSERMFPKYFREAVIF
jgi:Rad3-related DNA helicase